MRLRYPALTLTHTNTVVIRADILSISTGSPISTMFLSPGVTPWETTLPGVKDGANNPGIRVFEYDTETLLVKASFGLYNFH